MILRQILMGPPWLLTLLVKWALPYHHPWKHQRMTLISWVYRGTPFAYAFGLVIWMYLLLLPALEWITWTKR